MAYSIGKAPRCMLTHSSFLTLFIASEMKQNKSFTIGPGAYEATLINKKNDPKWT